MVDALKEAWELLREAGDHFSGEWLAQPEADGQSVSLRLRDKLPPSCKKVVNDILRECMRDKGFEAGHFVHYKARLQFFMRRKTASQSQEVVRRVAQKSAEDTQEDLVGDRTLGP